MDLLDKPNRFYHPSHTARVFDGPHFPALVDELVATATKIRRWFPFGALVGCGHSAAVVPTMAYVMKCDYALVRKPTDQKNHDGWNVNGAANMASYLIVDDLVGSGNTLAHIVEEVERAHRDQEWTQRYAEDLVGPKPVGVLLYEGVEGPLIRLHYALAGRASTTILPVFTTPFQDHDVKAYVADRVNTLDPTDRGKEFPED